MTTTIEPSSPLPNKVLPEMSEKQEPISTAEEKNKKLQKHLKSVEYVEDKTQFLMYKLDQDDYALDILTVKEILDIPPITRVPRTPSFMLGVINLRGAVVPVVDLKQRLGLDESEHTEDSCIIIVEIEGQNSQARIFGLLVDAVQEVISLTTEMITEVSKVGVHIDTGFLQGVGNFNDNFVLIMDLGKVLPVNESF